jgi:hypothetical protein
VRKVIPFTLACRRNGRIFILSMHAGVSDIKVHKASDFYSLPVSLADRTTLVEPRFNHCRPIRKTRVSSMITGYIYKIDVRSDFGSEARPIYIYMRWY